MTTHQKIHSSLRYFFLSLGLAASLCPTSQGTVSPGISAVVTSHNIDPSNDYLIQCICSGEGICLLGGKDKRKARPCMMVIDIEDIKKDVILDILEQTEQARRDTDEISVICRLPGRPKRFVTGSSEGVLAFWEADSKKVQLLSQSQNYGLISSLCCAPQGGMLALIDNGNVYLCDIGKYCPPKDSTKRIRIVGKDDELEDKKKGILLFGENDYLVQGKRPSIVCWAGNGRLAHDSGSSIILYDSRGGSIQKLCTLVGKEKITSLAFCHRGQKIATTHWRNRTIMVWNIAQKKCVPFNADHCVESLCSVPLFPATANGLLIQGYCRHAGKMIPQVIIHMIREYVEEELLAAGTQHGITCWDLTKRQKVDTWDHGDAVETRQLCCGIPADKTLLQLIKGKLVFRWLLKKKNEQDPTESPSVDVVK